MIEQNIKEIAEDFTKRQGNYKNKRSGEVKEIDPVIKDLGKSITYNWNNEYKIQLSMSEETTGSKTKPIINIDIFDMEDVPKGGTLCSTNKEELAEAISLFIKQIKKE